MMYRIMPSIQEWASHLRVQLDIPGFHPTIKINKDSLIAPMSGVTYTPRVGDYIFFDMQRMTKHLIPAVSMWPLGSM